MVHSGGSHVCDVLSTTLVWFGWFVDGWLGSAGVGELIAGGRSSLAT